MGQRRAVAHPLARPHCHLEWPQTLAPTASAGAAPCARRSARCCPRSAPSSRSLPPRNRRPIPPQRRQRRPRRRQVMPTALPSTVRQAVARPHRAEAEAVQATEAGRRPRAVVAVHGSARRMAPAKRAPGRRKSSAVWRMVGGSRGLPPKRRPSCWPTSPNGVATRAWPRQAPPRSSACTPVRLWALGPRCLLGDTSITATYSMTVCGVTRV